MPQSFRLEDEEKARQHATSFHWRASRGPVPTGQRTIVEGAPGALGGTGGLVRRTPSVIAVILVTSSVDPGGRKTNFTNTLGI